MRHSWGLLKRAIASRAIRNCDVDALTKSARDRNLDAATLAYVRVTKGCVDCHKFVRGKLVGRVN